jgi:hypothetical protein
LTLILVRNRKINLINDKMEFDLRNWIKWLKTTANTL